MDDDAQLDQGDEGPWELCAEVGTQVKEIDGEVELGTAVEDQVDQEVDTVGGL